MFKKLKLPNITPLVVVSSCLAPVSLLFTTLLYSLKIVGEVERVMKRLRIFSWQRRGEDFKMIKLLADLLQRGQKKKAKQR